VNIALEFREKNHEKINNERKLIEKLEKGNKSDILIKNALKIREKKQNEKLAKKFGTKPESVRQGIVIKNKAKTDPKIAADWEGALKGKNTIEAVYKKITKEKEKVKKKPKNKEKILDALHDITEQNHILLEKLASLRQVNQLISDKYDRLIQSLNKILTDTKTDNEECKKLLKVLENLMDEINNPQKNEIFDPSPKELRKAELKLN